MSRGFWEHPGGVTFLRFAFHGDATEPATSAVLDPEIEQVLWCSESEIHSSELPLRSPMVLRCIEDYRNGARCGLDCLSRIPPLRS